MKKLFFCAAALLIFAIGLNAEETPQTQPADNTQITLMSPNGGEKLQPGTVHKILWAAKSDPVTFSLQLSTDGGRSWRNLADGISGKERSYNWTVDAPPTTTARIKVGAITPMTVVMEDQSDRDFEIGGATPGTK